MWNSHEPLVSVIQLSFLKVGYEKTHLKHGLPCLDQ